MRNWANTAVKILLSASLVLVLFLQNGLHTVYSDPEVTITVKTIDNVALPNAVVKAYTVVDGNKLLNDTKTTDSSGKVTLSIRENKNYRLEIFYPSGFLVNVTTNFNYSALPKKELYVYVLSKWTLRITDKYGRDPLPNVFVRITHSENNSITQTGNTGSDGKVQFNFVPLGMTPYKVYEVNITYAGQYYIEEAECSQQNREVTIKLNLFRVIVAVRDVLNRPVQGIQVEIKRQLEGDALSRSSSNATGHAVLKLIPNGEYYLIAKLGEYEVYRSEEKIVKVMNADWEASITAQVVRLNITVYDFDGEAIISGLGAELTGEIRYGNKLVSTASTLEGELRFGYVPLGRFKLNVFIAGINVYSQEYEINEQTAKGSIRARFFDAKLTIDGSSLVNSTITRYLKGVLKKDVLEIPLDFSDGYMSLENVPAYSGYLVKLYYREYEVAETKIDITREGEEISMKIRGKNVTINTLNMYDKPLSAEIKIYLENGDEYFKFKTDNSGLGKIGELLSIKYKFKAYIMGVECGEVDVQPQASESYTMKVNVGNAYIKLYDKDRESTIPDALIELYVEKSKASSMTNSSGIASFENIPYTRYLYRVYMYGFKVGEGEANIGFDRQIVEVIAHGILDLRLTIVDSEKQPIDGGKIIITVGDKEITANIDQNGQARITNLPNTTLYIAGLYYKDVKVKTDTREIYLVSDEMPITISANIYTLQASVKLKTGELMKFGEVNIYVGGKKTSRITLSENNPFSERLPGGELMIEVVFKNTKVASKSFTLDASKELPIQADVYRFVSIFYNTLGERLKGLSLRLERENTLIEELETDENGMVDTYLPGGDYKIKISYGDDEYSSSIKISNTTQLSFMLPIQVFNPIIIMFLPLINAVIISLYFIGKLKTRSPHRKKKPMKTIRKVLKI
jgi:hypothetical protein